MDLSTKILSLFFVVLILTLLFWIISEPKFSSSNVRQQLFFIDTDIGEFTDDIGALAMMHSFADQRLVQILAIMANDRHDGIVPAIDVLNTYFNRSGLPIGITKDPQAPFNPENQTWTKFVVENYPHPTYAKNDDAEDAVKLYRRLLARQNNHSVMILSIGSFVNLANLLDSKPDEYSSLNGIELIQQKVIRMIAMAGQYPTGTEWNIQIDINASKQTLNQWPTEVIFVGFESGDHLICGKKFLVPNSTFLSKSPIKKAWEILNWEVDFCFDELAAWVAVKGVSSFYRQIFGSIEIKPNGTNVWHHSKDNEKTQMSYVKQVADDQEIVNAIDPLLER